MRLQLVAGTHDSATSGTSAVVAVSAPIVAGAVVVRPVSAVDDRYGALARPKFNVLALIAETERAYCGAVPLNTDQIMTFASPGAVIAYGVASAMVLVQWTRMPSIDPWSDAKDCY